MLCLPPVWPDKALVETVHGPVQRNRILDNLLSYDAAEVINKACLQSDLERAKEAVLVSGAQSFMVGQNTLDRYADYLRAQGIDWKPKV